MQVLMVGLTGLIVATSIGIFTYLDQTPPFDASLEVIRFGRTFYLRNAVIIVNWSLIGSSTAFFFVFFILVMQISHYQVRLLKVPLMNIKPVV
jgi:hypothetical protein